MRPAPKTKTAQVTASLAGGTTGSPEAQRNCVVGLPGSSLPVEWHLHKVFAKLAIGSRRELQAALAQRG